MCEVMDRMNMVAKLFSGEGGRRRFPRYKYILPVEHHCMIRQNSVSCSVPFAAVVAQRLVATSSGIVVFDGKDNCGKTEDELPYGTFQDAYQQSKIEMEKVKCDRTGNLELPVSNVFSHNYGTQYGRFIQGPRV
eukprot:scpid100668/ scgid4072/ 